MQHCFHMTISVNGLIAVVWTGPSIVQMHCRLQRCIPPNVDCSSVLQLYHIMQRKSQTHSNEVYCGCLQIPCHILLLYCSSCTSSLCTVVCCNCIPFQGSVAAPSHPLHLDIACCNCISACGCCLAVPIHPLHADAVCCNCIPSHDSAGVPPHLHEAVLEGHRSG